MTMAKASQEPLAAIGIIMLDTTFPRIIGDVGNPDTFSFPVAYKKVTGACPKRVVEEGDRSLIAPFIQAGQELVANGVKALATSCGFLALFQPELTRALPVPVFTSSLLQAHFIYPTLKAGQKIGILTASKASLTGRHLAAVGIDRYPLAVVGMDDAPEFRSVFLEGKTTLDASRCQHELLAAVDKLLCSHENIGALILECTNMGPYAPAIACHTKLPVYDVVTMITCIHSTVSMSSRPQLSQLDETIL